VDRLGRIDRKPERESGSMAIGFLNVVEGDFHHDYRFYVANVPVIFERVLEEKLGELSDFGIGHARIRFAVTRGWHRGFR